jgi:hypothetical protein
MGAVVVAMAVLLWCGTGTNNAPHAIQDQGSPFLLCPSMGETDSYIKMLRHDEACSGEITGPAVLKYRPCFKVYKGSKAGIALSDAEIASFAQLLAMRAI